MTCDTKYSDGWCYTHSNTLLECLRKIEAERDRYKAALEAILERHGVPCPAEGCGHPRCDFCIARKALKA